MVRCLYTYVHQLIRRRQPIWPKVTAEALKLGAPYGSKLLKTPRLLIRLLGCTMAIRVICSL